MVVNYNISCWRKKDRASMVRSVCMSFGLEGQPGMWMPSSKHLSTFTHYLTLIKFLLTQEIKGTIYEGAVRLFMHSICCLVTSLADHSNLKQDTELRSPTRSWKWYISEKTEDDEDKNVFYMHSFQITIGHPLCVSCSIPPWTWLLLFIHRLDQVSVYYSRL